MKNDAEEYQKLVLFHESMVHKSRPESLRHWVQNKNGFEIGSPSPDTWGELGVYDAAERIDITSCASNTLWGNDLLDGSPFRWKNQVKGIQYIRDAVSLYNISDNHYDFVCASHVLEHITNPIKAILEWLRIMRGGAILLLILPYEPKTFDHRRETVTLQHLRDDFINQTSEGDLSHLQEILHLQDSDLDPPAGNLASFMERSRNNLENRGLHHHVYDQELLYYIFHCLNLDVKLQVTWNIHQLIIGQKRQGL